MNDMEQRYPATDAKGLAVELSAIIATLNSVSPGSLNHRDLGAWVMLNADRILTALRTASATRPEVDERVERARLIDELKRLPENNGLNAYLGGYTISTDLRNSILATLSPPPTDAMDAEGLAEEISDISIGGSTPLISATATEAILGTGSEAVAGLLADAGPTGLGSPASGGVRLPSDANSHAPSLADALVEELKRLTLEQGPIVIDKYGEGLAWRSLDYGTWTILGALRSKPQAEGERAGVAAWQYERNGVRVLKERRCPDYTSAAMGFTETPLFANPTTEAMQAEIERLRPMAEWDTYEHRDDLVLLLVEFEDHPTDDATFALTIGGNNDHNVGPGEGQGWQFAGWCWTHDHFTEGKGIPVGWMPLPHHLAREREEATHAILADNQEGEG